MPIYISLFEPKKKAQVNGAVALVIALDAPNKKAAEGIAIGKLYEKYPESVDNFFGAKTVEDQTGHPRPAVGQFDAKFAAENVFDGNAWTPKEPEPEVPAGPVDLMAQPADIRIAAVVMYCNAEIDNHQLSMAADFINDEETPDDTGMRDLITGLQSVKAVGAMSPEAILRLAQAVIQNFGDDMPSHDDVVEFAQAWVNNPRDRENLTQTSTSTGNASGAADYNTLSMHTALSIMGVNPAEAKAADVKNAKEIIANRDNAWRAWDKTLRVIVGILNVETDVRHGIISDGLKNLKLISDDGERLHFVKSRLAGHPACAELADYGKDDEKPVEVANLGGGRFSIDGLIGSGEQQHAETGPAQSAASNQGEKTEVAQQQVTDAAAAQAKQQLDQMGYGVYANAPAEKSPQLQQAEENADRAEALAQQLKTDDFQQRAAQVEQVIAEQSAEDGDNLGIWNRVYKTDAKFTKAFSNNGGGTSINGTYMVMQATKVFGPQGINWGVEIIEERFDNGAPILRPVRQQDGSTIQEIIPNGVGGYLCEVNHTVKIRLWYKHGGKTGDVISYGCTPYIYATHNGRLFSDGEAPKKSLTDATKKALSQLGFSADVFLGLYDDLTYRQENDAEFALKNASEKAEGVTRMREELDEHLAKVAETLKGAVTANEATKVHGSVAREIEAHRKAADGKGDKEFAQYLAGRLRRLTALKDERIAALTEEKAS